MKKITGIVLIIGILCVAGPVFSSAFEEHTSWQKEPLLETAKGISLGKSVMELGMGFRYLNSNTYFNSNGKLTEEVNSPQFTQYIMDLFWRFGFTENWTFWTTLPIVWKSETSIMSDRYTSGEIGDADVGVLYQFYRKNDPTLSMGLSLRWKLPTGSETPRVDELITGTGTTDVELSYLFRGQLMENLSAGFSTGYNIRFPGVVQFLSDGNTGITNAGLDLGDEIYVRGEITGALEWVAMQLIAEFRYRFPTSVAIPQFNAETVRRINPITGQEESTTYVLVNGGHYNEWDMLDPDGNLVSSSGFLFTLTPKFILRPLEWVDVSCYASFHLAGKNSTFLVDNDNNHNTAHPS